MQLCSISEDENKSREVHKRPKRLANSQFPSGTCGIIIDKGRSRVVRVCDMDDVRIKIFSHDLADVRDVEA